jgi:spore coat polysaccharide biosynthesis protein SpsF
VIILQARMGSSRLPGKVLADLDGAPLLERLLARLKCSKRASGIIVATTDLRSDDAVSDLATRSDVNVFRGDPTDVLTRFCDAAREYEVDVIVRISADSPFLDGASIDQLLAAFGESSAEIVQNHREPGWPIGTAIEVFRRETLERLSTLATEARHREHVTLLAYERGDDFATEWVPPPPAVRAPALTLVVDTPKDLDRARRIQRRLKAPDAALADVVIAAREEQACASST